jgi:hypothetical protein
VGGRTGTGTTVVGINRKSTERLAGQRMGTGTTVVGINGNMIRG